MCAKCVNWFRLLANPASILNQPLSSAVKRGKTLALLAALRNHSLGFSPAFFALPSISILSVGVNRIIKRSLRRIVFFGLPGVRRFGRLLFSDVAAMYNSFLILKKIDQRERVPDHPFRVYPGFCIAKTLTRSTSSLMLLVLPSCLAAGCICCSVVWLCCCGQSPQRCFI